MFSLGDRGTTLRTGTQDNDEVAGFMAMLLHRIAMPFGRLLWLAVASGLFTLPSTSIAADIESEEVGPYPGTVAWPSSFGMRDLTVRLQRAAEANGLSVVATSGATSRDGSVTPNLVMLITRNEDASEIVKIDSIAGMELPIRVYLLEQADHHVSVIYRTPSSIFALYDNPKLDAIAGKMDEVFAKMVDEALGG